MLKQEFTSIMHTCSTNNNPTKLIKKAIMKSLGQCDFSAQEVMHHLMSLKLVRSSFVVVPISLNGSRRISRSLSDGELVTNESLLDIYATREKHAENIPDIMLLNFIDFATKYKPWKNNHENAWGDQPGSDEVHITSWKEFLETQYAKKHVPDWFEKLHSLQSLTEGSADTDHPSEQHPQ